MRRRRLELTLAPFIEENVVRILVTGSRTWDDWVLLSTILDNYIADHTVEGEKAVIIHGAAPRGADEMASKYCQLNPFTTIEERYPADWNKYGRRAGFVRNERMADLGADICFAFIKNNSPGATMTADLAETKGITTKRFEVNQ